MLTLSLSFALSILAAVDTPRPAAATIDVGPNMLVSRDGDVAHVELMVAGNPRKTKNLVGGAITGLRAEGGTACRAYASADGGSTWKPSEFPEQIEFGGGDPQAAFTSQGTALFTALAFVKDEQGRLRAALHVYRSEDGGLSWSKPADLGYSYDHEQVVVDQSSGRFANRIYIGTLYGYPVYRVGVFRSDDDGRTFVGPVEAANGGGTIGINVNNMLVLRDGTLFVPYVDFQFLPEKRVKGKQSSGLWFVTSSDGGVTFSSPKKIASSMWDSENPTVAQTGGGEAQGVDSQDNLLVVWTDYRLGDARLFFVRSSDRGQHWTEPAALDGNVPKGSLQFQPSVAANKNGALGVSWFDTRDEPAGRKFHEYFTATLDGGKTFLPAVRVSSAISDPDGAGNLRLTPMPFENKDEISMSFLSAASRWAGGGDYMGLGADKDGTFHPFWADSRSGTFQVYTAAVHVGIPEAAGKTPAAPPPAAKRELVALNGKVEIVFDPTRYDPTGKEAEIPIRIRNTSGKTIDAPVEIEITSLGRPPEYTNESDRKEEKDNAPTVLNASNGKPGVGAIFRFDEALGSGRSLSAGAMSGPVVMRFRLVDPKKTPSINFKIRGMAEEK
jgi:hypothetical protein